MLTSARLLLLLLVVITVTGCRDGAAEPRSDEAAVRRALVSAQLQDGADGVSLRLQLDDLGSARGRMAIGECVWEVRRRPELFAVRPRDGWPGFVEADAWAVVRTPAQLPRLEALLGIPASQAFYLTDLRQLDAHARQRLVPTGRSMTIRGHLADEFTARGVDGRRVWMRRSGGQLERVAPLRGPADQGFEFLRWGSSRVPWTDLSRQVPTTDGRLTPPTC